MPFFLPSDSQLGCTNALNVDFVGIESTADDIVIIAANSWPVACHRNVDCKHDHYQLDKVKKSDLLAICILPVLSDIEYCDSAY